MSTGKIQLGVDDLEALLARAKAAGTLDRWAQLAIEWMRGAAERYNPERYAQMIEAHIVNRPDDPVANSFDGGLRYAAKIVRENLS